MRPLSLKAFLPRAHEQGQNRLSPPQVSGQIIWVLAAATGGFSHRMCKGGIAPNPALSWDYRAISFIPWPQPGAPTSWVALRSVDISQTHLTRECSPSTRTRRTNLGELASHFGCLGITWPLRFHLVSQPVAFLLLLWGRHRPLTGPCTSGRTNRSHVIQWRRK